jgi:hypothetical protein
MRPDFIILGPSRTGTTSIYHYLRQHPGVFMSPVKETRYFAYLAVQAAGSSFTAVKGWQITDWRQYQAQFEGARPGQAAGEATPLYFYVPGVPEQIRARLPDVRLIAILRNPAERAYSLYQKYVRDGLETRSFEQAVQDELEGRAHRLSVLGHYVDIGYYHRHLSRFLRSFPRAQLGLFIYDDLQAAPADFMRSMFEFIGVDPVFATDTSVRFNRSGASAAGGAGRLAKRWRNLIPHPLYMALHRAFGKLQPDRPNVAPLSSDMRRRLCELYAPDLGALQQLTGRDHSGWLDV